MKSLIRNAIFIKYVNENSISKNIFIDNSLRYASFLSCFPEYVIQIQTSCVNEISRHEWVNEGFDLSNAEAIVYFHPKHKDTTIFENHLNPAMLVFIEQLSLSEHSQLSTHVPEFQSFFKFLHNFVMAKLATSSIRVNSRI